jgi:hypothetical protein
VTPAVFVDMDGVLADFVRGAFRLHGKSIPMRDVQWGFPAQIGFESDRDPAFWRGMDRAFWAGLEPLADGFALFRAVERMIDPERIALLTSAAGEDGCIDGKRDWIRRHLPDYLPRLFTGSAKELFAAPAKLLIDDNDVNAARFRRAGGAAVLVPRPWNVRGWGCDADGGFDPPSASDDVRTALAGMTRIAA